MATKKKAKATKKKATKKTATKKAATKKAATKKMATRKTAGKKTATKKAAGTKKTATKGAATTKTATKKMATQVTATPAMAAQGAKLSIGQEVPNFEVEATGGTHVTLQGLKGKAVVLYFYPKDDTPGCTIEGHEFTKLHDQFKEIGAEVYGVSKDDMNSHEKFKEKQCYTIDLLSDTKGDLCEMFDVVKMKNMYGREYLGIERSTFVIDADGKLIQEWRGVKVPGHAQEVLDFLRNR